jgi:AAA domain
MADRAAKRNSTGPAKNIGDAPVEAPPDAIPVDAIEIVSAEEFAAVEEAGAEPIVGALGEAAVPANGDAMIFGDGGASKTTLAVDLGCHIAAGDDWLGIEVPKPRNVLVVEAEGARPMFRTKIRGKLECWSGSPLEDRLRVWQAPWASFRFPNAAEVAHHLGEIEVDVLIVGPLAAVGWEDLGTLQEVRAFMGVVAEFRHQTGRSLTVVMIHHENKGGKVSGSFEGAGDTLLHAEVKSRGKTHLTFQKTRWSSEWHKRRLELEWTDGEGFEPVEEPERDLVAEITAWMLARPEHRHSTAKEIATEKRIEHDDGSVEKFPGIGANETEVRDTLEDHQDVFRRRTGEHAKAVGRHASAKVWDLKDVDDEDG